MGKVGNLCTGKQQNNTRATMANNGNSNNLQSIVNNVVNHPQFRLLVNDAVETSRSALEASQKNQLTSNGANPTSNSNSPLNGGTDGHSTYSSPVEEFNSIFRFGVTRQQQGAGTISSFTTRSTTRGCTQSLNSRRSRRYSPTAMATSATRNTAFT